jgi:hypothetical protein
MGETFFETKGTSDVVAVDLFEPLPRERVFKRQLHFPDCDDARHHILDTPLDDIAEMQTPVNDVHVIFMHHQHRRVVEERDLDVFWRQLAHKSDMTEIS